MIRPSRQKPKQYDPNGRYTVQVASYPTAEEAKDHVGQLVKNNYRAFYLTVNIKKKMWNRVNVGIFSTKKKGLEFLKNINRKTLEKRL